LHGQSQGTRHLLHSAALDIQRAELGDRRCLLLQYRSVRSHLRSDAGAEASPGKRRRALLQRRQPALGSVRGFVGGGIGALARAKPSAVKGEEWRFAPDASHPSPFTLHPSPFTLHSSLFTLESLVNLKHHLLVRLVSRPVFLEFVLLYRGENRF